MLTRILCSRRRTRALALLLVVMVLSSMLILGTAFMHNIRLDYDAAVNYARAGQAEIFALDGLHRGISELMYDVWGVDEDTAFVCSAEWGQLTKGISVEGTDMTAAYAYDGVEPIVSRRSLFRRTRTAVNNGTVNVETDFRWVDKESLLQPGLPVQSGGYYWDEFLPEAGDNSDAFETALMLNHGAATDRDYLNDEKTTAAQWSGYFWPAGGGGAQPPWDYIDTRIVPDSIFHVFRFDLLDPNDWGAHCTGVLNHDPKQLVASPRTNVEFRATHLGFAANAGWADSKGGAVNINPVNNNYTWEVYFNWRDYAGTGGAVPAWSPHHFKEAKWITVYDPAGTTPLGRYAITVWPDNGQCNPNYMYDGTQGGQWNQNLEVTSKYLLSLDQGYSPHGAAIGGKFSSDPDAGPNNIKSKTVVDPPPGYSDWAHQICTRFAQHKMEHSTITTRAELAMLIRKWGFDSGAVSKEDLDRDAALISALISPSSYEYLLGPHWQQDRLLIDVCRNGSLLTGDMPQVTAAFKQLLQDLEYYWGPDSRNGADGTYTDAVDPLYRRTPYFEQDMTAPSPTSPWDARARRAKAIVLAWMGTNREYDYGGENYYQGDRTADGYQLGTLQRLPLVSRAAMAGGDVELVAPGALQINEVGRFIPAHPTRDEHANGDGSIGGEGEDVGFDPADPKEYYFVELVQYHGLNRRHAIDTLRQNGSLYVNGVDVLVDPATRIVGRNPDQNLDGVRTYPESGNPDADPNLYGPSKPGAWLMQNLPIMIAPSNASNPTGKTNLVWAITLSNNHYSGPTWAHSFSRSHPWNFLVVYFPAAPQYDGDEVVFVNRNGAVLDYANLPGTISALPAPAGAGTGHSYSAPDYSNNLHPNNWQVMTASPSWHKKFTDTISTRWIDGQNDNFWPQSWPEYRVDIDNVSKARDADRHHSHIAVGRLAYMNITNGGYPFRREFDLLRTASGFTPEFSYRELELSHPTALNAEGVYEPYGVADPSYRTWLLHHFFDPDLVIWRDLMRVAPIERYMVTGALGPVPNWLPSEHTPANHTDYAAFDGEDNNLDGFADQVGTDPLMPSGMQGLYVTDRKAVGKLNLNLAIHPSIVFYAASYANWNPTLQIGRKPLAGYTSVSEWQTRLHYYYGDSTPYDKVVWYDNLFSDLSSDHWINWGGGHLDTELQQTYLNAYAEPSPVYTVYVTAQTVTRDEDDPDILQPTSEIKLRATVERTWDGKLNFLEFNWIPQDVASVQ